MSLQDHIAMAAAYTNDWAPSVENACCLIPMAGFDSSSVSIVHELYQALLQVEIALLAPNRLPSTVCSYPTACTDLEPDKTGLTATLFSPPHRASTAIPAQLSPLDCTAELSSARSGA